MKTFIIYRITFPTGQFYIGQTHSHEYIRWGTHLQDLKLGRHNNPQMQEIYNEYGYDDFEFEILVKDTSDDKYYVSLLERYIINEHPNTINSYTPRKTDEELKEHIQKTRKEYNTKHKYGGKQYKRNYHKHYYQQKKHETLSIT